MKKFVFQLDKLLSYKGQMLDSEMTALAILNHQLSEAQKKLLALQTKQTECAAEYEGKMLRNISPAICKMYTDYGEHLKEQILAARRMIDTITRQVEKQIEVIKGLKMETKSLETLKSTRLEEYNKEGAKAAELQLEEFVTTSGIQKSL